MADFEHDLEKENNEINSETEAQQNESAEIVLDAPKESKYNFSKDIIDYIEIFILALGAVVLLFSFCFRLCTVSGDSMKNTLYDGESVIVSDIFYKPTRGDIIVFHDANELKKPLVKRVIATEGETVRITYLAYGMDVYITDVNGDTFKYSEPYANTSGNGGTPPFSYGAIGETVEYTVPENKIFVMGDNRNGSSDSRVEIIGFIDERMVIGKVTLRLLPISEFEIF